MSETCPGCGAAAGHGEESWMFACGTYEAHEVYSGNPYWDRTKECMEAQIASLTQALETERLLSKSLSEHVEAHEGELKAEIAALEGLVREMGEMLQDYPGLLMPCHAKEVIEEILNHPIVKKIMEEREDDNSK